ncbi:MAG: hypothetical protein V1647_03165 [Pseudomonadota bacterium]
MKKLVLITAALMLVTVYGCIKAKGYKSEYVYNFITACIQSQGTPAVCSCIMDHVQENMSEKAFLEEDSKYMATGKFSDSYMNMVAAGKTKCGGQ